MPNYQEWHGSGLEYDGQMLVRTLADDETAHADAGEILFSTPRGQTIWLPPADVRSLIVWLHNALGDALPATLPAPVDMPKQRSYKPCAATDPDAPDRRCVLIEDHGSASGHVGMFGDRW